MKVDKTVDNAQDLAASEPVLSPYLRAVMDELNYLDAWKAGHVSPISAAIRVRQIRNARLIPDTL